MYRMPKIRDPRMRMHMRISVHEDPRMHIQISKNGDPRMRMQMRISVQDPRMRMRMRIFRIL